MNLKTAGKSLFEIIEGIVGFTQANGLSDESLSTNSSKVNISPLQGSKNIIQAQKKDRYVLFSIHQVDVYLGEDGDSEKGFNRQIIFLLAPYDHQPNEPEIASLIQDTYPFYNQEDNDNLHFNDIARAASRVYPWYILLDPKLWEDIEKEEGVNLALSAEEEKILFSLSSAGPKNYKLPIFINGRAGSGKSTILFYIFAEFCIRLLELK